MKALAYARAVDEYCFPIESLVSLELTRLASRQMRLLNTFAGPDPRNTIAAALNHLKSDQVACEPAVAFVGRTISAGETEELTRLELRADEVEQAVQRMVTEKAQANALAAIRSQALECEGYVEQARVLIAEQRRLSASVIPQSLIKCLKMIPETPETNVVRREIEGTVTLVKAILEVEYQADRQPKKQSLPTREASLQTLYDQVVKCWNLPAGAVDDGMKVSIEVKVNQSGGLASVLVRNTGSLSDRERLVTESAKRAVSRCVPYNVPAGGYLIVLDTNDMS